MVMDIEEYMENIEREREDKYNKFMNTCANKFGKNGDLIYRAMALFIAKRFDVHIPEYGDVDSCIYIILNHYVENVEEDFETWINKNDAPIIRKRDELRRIFPEFKFIKDDYELIETVNKIYNLDLDITSESVYFYSISFDFNSFKPIEVEKVHELKHEIKILKKYGFPTEKLEEELNEFGLEPEIMEVL